MEAALFLENGEESETTSTSCKCKNGISDYGLHCVIYPDLWVMICGAQAQPNVLRLPLCHCGLPDGHPQKWAVCQEAGDVCEGVGGTWEEVGDVSGSGR